MDLCFELATQIMARISDVVSPEDEVHGFRYLDDRDLLGFVDGTENPRNEAVMEAALIGAEDAAFAPGSCVIVQKYLHDLDGWNALSAEAQERIIGRTEFSDIELDDSVKPTSAHNALTTITEDGKMSRFCVTTCPSATSHPVNLALTLLATAVRRAGLSKCSRTCSLAAQQL
jgi:putative iron-dependent peroxidase